MDDSQILSKGRISFKVCLENFQYIDVRESSRLSIPAVVYIARQSHKGFDVVVRYFPSKRKLMKNNATQKYLKIGRIGLVLP